MGRYHGTAIFSDVDGTLMSEFRSVPQNNIDAIAYYIKEGGLFGLATGRGILTCRDLIQKVVVNGPCVLLNGAMIYDYQKDEAISVLQLPAGAKQMIEAVLKNRPELRAVVWGFQNRYDVGAKVKGNYHYPPNYLPVEEINEPWLKLMFEVHPLERVDFIAWLESMQIKGVSITSSCDFFVEVIPQTASKGVGVERLVQHLGLNRKKVFVVGDYFNDYDMLTLPDIHSFCPQNAHPEIKKICHQTLCSVEEGCIEDLIGRL